MGEGRLAGSRRTIKNERPEPVGSEQSTKQFVGAEEVFLADELVESPRPHPRSQRLGLAAIGRPAFVK
jgi:hypothetical protein